MFLVTGHPDNPPLGWQIPARFLHCHDDRILLPERIHLLFISVYIYIDSQQCDIFTVLEQLEFGLYGILIGGKGRPERDLKMRDQTSKSYGNRNHLILR